MKNFLIGLSLLCLSSAASAETPTRFYNVHQGETWEIRGWLSSNVKQESFQYAYTSSQRMVGNSVQSFSWAHNQFDIKVHYAHDGRIYLTNFSIGNGSASLTDASKQ
jgi:hypothetical protein